MNAMEKMIASMLGISPEEMGAMVTGFQELLTGLKSRLETIERNQRLIMDHLGVTYDDGSKGNSDRDNVGGTGSDSDRIAAE